MLHRTWSTRNDYERKINYDWPYRMDKISKTKKQNKTNKQTNKKTNAHSSNLILKNSTLLIYYMTHILSIYYRRHIRECHYLCKNIHFNK